MAEILILNGSPRAPRSNSKQYAELFSEQCRAQTKYLAVGRDNQAELCGALEDCTDLLLVFPLYADGIPVPLLRALKAFEKQPPKRRPTVSVLINCGFYEWSRTMWRWTWCVSSAVRPGSRSDRRSKSAAAKRSSARRFAARCGEKSKSSRGRSKRESIAICG